MTREEFEYQHRMLHLIAQTARQGRPSTTVCPACEARAANASVEGKAR